MEVTMPRYTINVHRQVDDISPVAAAVCGYCKSIVLCVGSIGAEEVCLPLVCEQPASNNYPCGASMALIHDKSVRELLDGLAAEIQQTDS